MHPLPQHAEDCLPPLQPTLDRFLKLLEGEQRLTAVMSFVHRHKERDYAALAASGARQIQPCYDPRLAGHRR